MERITRADLPELFAAAAETMAARSEELGAMDALMGDGDLGLTMKKGFSTLPALIRDLPDTDIGTAVVKAGMKLSAIIPSTMGFLMGSGLMAGGKAISGSETVGAAEYAAFLRGFADGVARRGKCSPGDCTVLDAVDAAAGQAEARLSATPGASLADIAAAAKEGALAGAEATRHMTPKFGKAAVHQAASSGVMDQGAYAGFCLLSAFCGYIEKQRAGGGGAV